VCPTCPRDAVVTIEAGNAVVRKTLDAGCRICNERWRISPDTYPLVGTFRDWSSEEQRELMIRHNKQALLCPVDDTVLKVYTLQVGGSPVVGAKAQVVECGRCGRSCSEPG